MQFGTPKTVAQAIAPFNTIQTNLKAVLGAQKAKRAAAEAVITTARNEIEKAKDNAARVSKSQGAIIESAMNEELQAQTLFDNLQKLFDTSKPVDVATMKPSEKANAGHALDS